MRVKKEFQKSKTDMLLDSLQLPKDILRGDIRITLTGNREVWIENYKGILEYTNQSILLQAKSCKVQFEGKGLSIDYYTNEDMKLTGRITSIKYL
ncbi:MAG: YabP/YqfC family sporulation protein [Lachnospiraceae bacterium]|nr:YabP/YqfC family sporulation protein [Lachnospiraceae bacterium]